MPPELLSLLVKTQGAGARIHGFTQELGKFLDDFYKRVQRCPDRAASSEPVGRLAWELETCRHGPKLLASAEEQDSERAAEG